MVVSTLLHNGFTFRQSTSAPDNQVQVFTISVPKIIQYKPLSPRVQSGHRVCGPFPPKTLPAASAEVWHEEVRPQRPCPCLLLNRMTHGAAGGWTWKRKKSKGMGAFQNIHTQRHSCLPFTDLIQCPLEWLPGCPRDVCSILWRKKGPVPFYSNNIYEVLSMCKGLCKTPGINLWGKTKRGLDFTQLFSTDVLTTNYVLDNVLGVKSNSSEENIALLPSWDCTSVGEIDCRLIASLFHYN